MLDLRETKFLTVVHIGYTDAKKYIVVVFFVYIILLMGLVVLAKQ